MSPSIEERVDEMTRLCLRHGVQRLDLFGSAASDTFRPGESDLDFLVEFRPSARHAYADAYFDLLDALQRLFGCPVDLVVESAIRNPYFRQSVYRTRTPLYAVRG